MHRCRFCLCHSCMNTCWKCGECNAAVKSCERHREFKQLNLFEPEKPAGSMKVLVACEESQRVCIEFRRLGHEAYSCDIEPESGGHPEWHIRQDVLPLLNGNCEFQTVDGEVHRIDGKWDMIIAFPPCTYLTVAGNRWFDVKRYGNKAVERAENRKKAIQFFMRFVNADCEKIAIENPVGVMSTEYRKPDCIIQPWMFGHNASKRTCLWLKNLQGLKATEIIHDIDARKENQQTSYDGKLLGFMTRDDKGKPTRWNDPETAKIRSKTFPRIAKAMAEQWGGQAENRKKLIRDYTWEDYGISKARYRELRDMCRSGKYDALVRQTAHKTAPDIEGYIYLSVVKNKSYRALEVKWDLGEMERMPYNANDFYGYRRYFYYLLDLEVRRENV